MVLIVEGTGNSPLIHLKARLRAGLAEGAGGWAPGETAARCACMAEA